MAKLAVVVHSCDRYKFLYEGFYHFFQKNFKISDVAFYFLTEELDINLPGFINIKTGKGEWSNRLKFGLNQIREDYILYIQEDCWLKAPVPDLFFKDLLKYLENKKNKFIKAPQLRNIHNSFYRYLFSRFEFICFR